MTNQLPDFQHVSWPFRLYYGGNCLTRLGPELDRVKSIRAVVIFSIPLNSQGILLLDRVRTAIGDRYAGAFTEVRAHSPISAVQSAAQELKRLEADAIIAVGGGSAIVTARAASIMLAEGEDVRKLCTVQDEKGEMKSPKLMAPKLPQFIISTTPNTAVVKAGSAVFDPATGERLALFDPKTRAQALFLDPPMLMSAPRTLIERAALNTFATAMEGLISRVSNPLADAQLMHALRLLAKNIMLLRSQDTEEVRGELALAGVLCGQGTDNTGAGITIVLGHAIGARHEMDNGIANAIILPHALSFNAGSANLGMSKIGVALGLSESEPGKLLKDILKKVEDIFQAVEAPRRLRDVDVPREALGEIANSAIGDWCLRGNPRPVRDASELLKILNEAW
jgi:alcohol dehydrogenase class IV